MSVMFNDLKKILGLQQGKEYKEFINNNDNNNSNNINNKKTNRACHNSASGKNVYMI